VPRANLSANAVLAKAVELADRFGYERLSMAAIAQEFGVKVPSLYKHVASLTEVRRELAAQALRELAVSMRIAAGAGDRREALLGVALAYRGYAQAHPGLYAAIVGAPDPADPEIAALSQEVLEVVYGVLSAYGRTHEDQVHDVRALRAALHGFISLEAAGGFGLPVDVEESFVRMIGVLDTALRQTRN
jgi:AcrR family transcriptional regulator